MELQILKYECSQSSLRMNNKMYLSKEPDVFHSTTMERKKEKERKKELRDEEKVLSEFLLAKEDGGL